MAQFSLYVLLSYFKPMSQCFISHSFTLCFDIVTGNGQAWPAQLLLVDKSHACLKFWERSSRREPMLFYIFEAVHQKMGFRMSSDNNQTSYMACRIVLGQPDICDA